tara:strand:+ start:96 stop:638 length:543 start_codon:yes stop_codon:yes gene_type:complete
MQPIKKYFLWVLFVLLSTGPISAANDRPVIEENQGKALLIYNIAKFTLWPAATASSDTPFTFTLWNDNALADALQIIEGLETQGRKIRINHQQKGSIAGDCQVIIIPKNQLQQFIKARGELDKLPILTVTTEPNVFEAGAMVLVEVVDDHLSFSVNLAAVKASGLEISGNLLRHAHQVKF